MIDSTPAFVPQEHLTDSVSRPPDASLRLTQLVAFGIVGLSLFLLAWQFGLWAAAIGAVALGAAIYGLLATETLSLLDNDREQEEDRSIRQRA